MLRNHLLNSGPISDQIQQSFEFSRLTHQKEPRCPPPQTFGYLSIKFYRVIEIPKHLGMKQRSSSLLKYGTIRRL